MNLLRAKDEIGERKRHERLNIGTKPLASGCGSCFAVHKSPYSLTTKEFHHPPLEVKTQSRRRAEHCKAYHGGDIVEEKRAAYLGADMVSLKIICLSIALMIATGVPAAAQTYLSEYQLYVAALEAGDDDAAARHAKAAWDSAEQVLGDDPTTAILALNYAQMIYLSEPQNAIAPLARTIALIDSGVSELPRDEPELMLALVGSLAAPESDDAMAALETVLNEQSSRSVAATDLSASAWLLVASHNFRVGKSSRAIEAAEIAELQFKAVMPGEKQYQGNARLIRGAANLTKKNRRKRDIVNAHDALYPALYMYPPQDGLDTFDRNFAAVITWHSVSHAIARSDSVFLGTRAGVIELEDNADTEPMIWSSSAHPALCELRWKHRSPPKYPRAEAYSGHIGGALIGFDFDDQLKVTNARIISEVPSTTEFGEVSLNAAKAYELESLPVGGKACLKNWTTIFTFSF